MSNNWFKFKEFGIEQDKCAMKVGTDGVILGAWTDVNQAKNALDIGTGTGLLALMLAQRNSDLKITALEIDKYAAIQATENVIRSKYRNQINVIESDFRKYVNTVNRKFDLIICNPPYFHSSHPANKESRTLARHSGALSPEHILSGSFSLLYQDGKLSIIIPKEQEPLYYNLAAEWNLYPSRTLNVKPIPGKEVNRICIEFSKKKQQLKSKTILIELKGRHIFSEEYKELTGDFYLKF